MDGGLSVGVDRNYLRSRIREARDAMSNMLRISAKPFESLTLDEKYSMRYQVVVLAEALGSICLHIALNELGREPESYSECFALVSEKGFFRCLEDLVSVVRLRNLLVHRYWIVDDSRIHRSVLENFKCIEEFLGEVERRYGLR
mgnify:CR=1 FL=1